MSTNQFADAIAAGNYATCWVCTDCFVLLVNGEMPTEPTVYAPLSLFSSRDDVSPGLLAEEHADGCEESNREEGCDCDTATFSHASCDGCGDPAAGRRHAVTAVSTP